MTTHTTTTEAPTRPTWDFGMIPGETVTVRLNPDGTFDVSRITPTGDARGTERIGPWVHCGETFVLGACEGSLARAQDVLGIGSATLRSAVM